MKCLPQILFLSLLSLTISGVAFDQYANTSNTQKGLATVDVIAIGSLGGEPIRADDIKSGKVGFIVAPVVPNSGLSKKGRTELKGSDGKMYTLVDLDDIETLDKSHSGIVNPNKAAAARVQLFPAVFSPAKIDTQANLILNVNKSDPIVQVIYNEMTGAISAKEANGQLNPGKNINFKMPEKLQQ